MPDPGFAELLEAIPLAAFVVDPTIRLISANTSARTLFGNLPQGTLIYLKFREPELKAVISATIADGKPRHMEFHEKVPIERWFRVDVTPLLQKDLANAYLLLFRDTSESRNIDKMRTDFVANASHELRTPLASLSGFIETLRGPARDDPIARERFLTIMQEQASRMSRLIDDLLSLSRLEMRPFAEKTTQIDLADIAREVIDAMGPMAQENGVDLKLETVGDTSMMGIRDEMVEVVENLVENAIKYGRSGKRVLIGVKARENSSDVVLSVRDFGQGIDASHVPRLTERFYRADAGNQPSAKGTGLGLSIVKHILSRHQAHLTIQSSPGEGATFVAYFRKSE